MEGNIKLRPLHGVEHLVAGVIICLHFPPRAPLRETETGVCVRVQRERKLASITGCRAYEINRLSAFDVLS